MGKKKYLKSLENSFVSSTFWTDRIGYAAAIKTLNLMSENKTWLKLKKKGLFIKKIWKDCAEKYRVNITIQGLDAIPTLISITIITLN